MVRITAVTAIIIAAFIFVFRFAIQSNSFLGSGVMESLQGCRDDTDCIWAPTGCCACDQGGGELLINKDKQTLYNLLIKEVCLGESICSQRNECHMEEVYCDNYCKFGERVYSKPLLQN